ncbi:YceD family protein [Roseomonas sp. USHLN139]|uniref:YceD family protein n=1 Tax=Roseomonas sp. USHLN139 TaxID=3081298 RepID=UPI003B02C077
MTTPDPVLEFSRTLPWGAIGPEGRRQAWTATPAECAALAKRFDIPAIHAFSVELQLEHERGGTIRCRGQLKAQVVQSCVVTLEPVEQAVEEAVDLRILPPGRDATDDPEGPDEIETERGSIELGEPLAEQLSLALDPYPRAPGAVLPEADLDDEEDAAAAEAPARPNPFAVLKGGKK